MYNLLLIDGNPRHAIVHVIVSTMEWLWEEKERKCWIKLRIGKNKRKREKGRINNIQIEKKKKRRNKMLLCLQYILMDHSFSTKRQLWTSQAFVISETIIFGVFGLFRRHFAPLNCFAFLKIVLPSWKLFCLPENCFAPTLKIIRTFTVTFATKFFINFKEMRNLPWNFTNVDLTLSSLILKISWYHNTVVHLINNGRSDSNSLN